VLTAVDHISHDSNAGSESWLCMAWRAAAAAACGAAAGGVAAYVFAGGYSTWRSFPIVFTPPARFSLSSAEGLVRLAGFAVFFASVGLVSAVLALLRAGRRGAISAAELASALQADLPFFLAPGACVLVPLLLMFGADPGLWVLFVLISAVTPPLTVLMYRIAALIAWSAADSQPSPEEARSGEFHPPASEPCAGRLPSLAPAVLAVVTVAFCALFAVQTVRLYHALNLGYCDSGYVAEALSNTLRGRFLWCNSLPFGNYLGDHFSPILLLLLPLYALVPMHETLLVLHAVAIGSGAVPVYLLGRRLAGSRFAGLTLGAAYLLHPAVQLQNFCFSYAFKAVSLGVPLLLWAGYFGVTDGRRRAAGFVVFSVLALACEESLVPVVLSLGVFTALRRGEPRRRRTGWLVAVLALAWWVAATDVIMPHIRHGAPSKQLHTFYGWMREPGQEPSVAAVLLYVLRHPLVVVKQFGRREVFVFLAQMLLPLGALPLLCPAALAVGAVTFLFLVLSSQNAFLSIAFQYKAGLIPVVFLAAAMGLGKTSLLARIPFARKLTDQQPRRPGRPAMALGCLVVVSAALHCYAFGPTPLSYGYTDAPYQPDRYDTIRELQRIIPRDASLLTTERAAAHFTRQRLLHRLGHEPPADYDFVLLDLENKWQDLDQTFTVRNRYLADARYAPVFARDGFVLFRKGARRPPELQQLGPAGPRVLQQVQDRAGWKVGEEAEIIHVQFLPHSEAGRTGERRSSGRASSARLLVVWRCLKPIADDRGVLLTISRPSKGGSESFTRVCRPCGGLFPTSRWKPGMVILDRYEFRLPFDPSEGETRLELNWAPRAPGDARR